MLAGDAAHVHSVNGGQGLNTGIADAFALAWRLASVLTNDGLSPDAADRLIRSYDVERRTVAQGVIDVAAALVRDTIKTAKEYVSTIEKNAGYITGKLVVLFRSLPVSSMLRQNTGFAFPPTLPFSLPSLPRVSWLALPSPPNSDQGTCFPGGSFALGLLPYRKREWGKSPPRKQKGGCAQRKGETWEMTWQKRTFRARSDATVLLQSLHAPPPII